MNGGCNLPSAPVVPASLLQCFVFKCQLIFGSSRTDVGGASYTVVSGHQQQRGSYFGSRVSRNSTVKNKQSLRSLAAGFEQWLLCTLHLSITVVLVQHLPCGLLGAKQLWGRGGRYGGWGVGWRSQPPSRGTLCQGSAWGFALNPLRPWELCPGAGKWWSQQPPTKIHPTPEFIVSCCFGISILLWLCFYVHF